MVAVDAAEEEAHPLDGREIGSIRDWTEWLSLWRAGTTHEILSSLLYLGFDVPTDQGDERARILFYFDIARGWREAELNIRAVGKRPENAVQVKAWSMLCWRVFRRAEKEFQAPDRWWSFFLHEDLFDALLKFFLRCDERGNLENVPRHFDESVEAKMALKFLGWFVEQFWEREVGRTNTDFVQKFLASKQRQKFFHLLIELQRLDLLRRSKVDQVTSADLKFFERLALENAPKGSTVELVYACSLGVGGNRYLAESYILLRAQREGLRLKKELDRVAAAEDDRRRRERELADAERDRNAADRKMKALAGK